MNIEERKFVAEIDSALAENTVSFLRKLKFFLFRDDIKSQNPWPKVEEGPSRDRMLHEFFDNPIYFLFRKALLKKEFSVPQSKPEMQKVCLYSAILCWLANADSKITLPEMKSSGTSWSKPADYRSRLPDAYKRFPLPLMSTNCNFGTLPRP